MIDLILFVFVLTVFYAGFWCGKTYGSIKAMVKAAHAWMSSLLKE